MLGVSDTSRIMNMLSVKILILNNSLRFLEKWLVIELVEIRKIHDESRTSCARNKEMLKNGMEISKELTSQLEEAPMIQSGII